MKKTFEIPQIKIINCIRTNVITTSGGESQINSGGENAQENPVTPTPSGKIDAKRFYNSMDPMYE